MPTRPKKYTLTNVSKDVINGIINEGFQQTIRIIFRSLQRMRILSAQLVKSLWIRLICAMRSQRI